MARTAKLSARDRGWNTGSDLLISMGSRSCCHLRSLLAAPGDDGRGISGACGALNRAGGVSVLLVVEQGSGSVSTPSGAVILPEPDAFDAAHRAAQAMRS